LEERYVHICLQGPSAIPSSFSDAIPETTKPYQQHIIISLSSSGQDENWICQGLIVPSSILYTRSDPRSRWSASTSSSPSALRTLCIFSFISFRGHRSHLSSIRHQHRLQPHHDRLDKVRPEPILVQRGGDDVDKGDGRDLALFFD
jgi:hypothetical protein